MRRSCESITGKGGRDQEAEESARAVERLARIEEL